MAGYADQEGYNALVGYDLLNIFASNYLTSDNGNIITGDKIISNGNCMFHALGYAYYASLTEPTDADNNYAVPKRWYEEDGPEPVYNITLEAESDPTSLLLINNYNKQNIISELKTDANKKDINDKALAIKTRVARTIIKFKDEYNKRTLGNDLNPNIVSGDNVTFDNFITPIFGTEQYHQADDSSIYASAFLLNKIICIIICEFEFNDDAEKSRYNIVNYNLFGPINMKCTKENILFLLYVNYGHYETFYSENDKPHIIANDDIVERFNDLIGEYRDQKQTDDDMRFIPTPEPFFNHLETYSFLPRDIVLDFNKKPKINVEQIKSKVTNSRPLDEESKSESESKSKLNSDFDTEFEKNKEIIEAIDPNEKNEDKLYDNQALLNKLLEENQELDVLLKLEDNPEEEIRIYRERKDKIIQLINLFIEKVPPSNTLPLSNKPLSSSKQLTNEPLSIKVPPSTPSPPLAPPSTSSPPPSNKLRTPTKYSFYSKTTRPVLNLPLTSTIPYTPYIFRQRTRKPLQLKPLK
jgi:hypothetical protein